MHSIGVIGIINPPTLGFVETALVVVVFFVGRNKMRKLIINVLEAYIYIAIIITIGAIFYISDTMGINSIGIIIIYILLVPLIFGLIILAIDNNALLRDIRDNINNGKTQKVSEDLNITNKDQVLENIKTIKQMLSKMPKI